MLVVAFAFPMEVSHAISLRSSSVVIVAWNFVLE